MKKVFSLDKDDFYCSYSEMLLAIDNEPIKPKTIFMANEVSVSHADFLNIDELIESMRSNASSINYNSASCFDYVEDVSEGTKKRLKEAILNILNDEVSTPSFAKLEAIKEISLEEFYSFQSLLTNNIKNIYNSYQNANLTSMQAVALFKSTIKEESVLVKIKALPSDIEVIDFIEKHYDLEVFN